MLGSFPSSSHSHAEEDHPYQIHHHQIQIPPAIHLRQLLISCAELISTGSDPSSAHRLLAVLMANSTPCGDSTERLIHHFTTALSLLLNRSSSSSTATVSAATAQSDHQLVQSSYLSLNQVTPYIRFSQLTANQAILDAIDEGQEAIHILDFDIMHGLQWPPFMQAIKERHHPQPTLRITGTGDNLETLRRTGDRLSKFAHSLNLRFQFHPLLILDDDPATFTSSVVLLPGETLAVNCVHYVHRLLKNRDWVRFFLYRIKGMNPRIVTMAEREANHNHPVFLQRFVEALDHYAAVFDSLEATLPPTSGERLSVEKVWFGREIVDIVAGKELRHERFRSWELMFRSSGFSNVPLSTYAVSQAKLLLRLHYPSEGYQLHILDDSLFLGWQNQPLFSVSSWR